VAKLALNLVLNALLILSSPCWIAPYLVYRAASSPAQFWAGATRWPVA
jgi:hypothetical protein